MKLKRAALAGAALLALLVFVPFLLPMGAYVKQVEQVASETLGQPVSVGFLRLALLPTPRVNVGDIRIGRNDDVRVDNIAVMPQLSSLFSEVKIISSIVVKHPTVKESALDFFSAMPKPKSSGGPAKVLIRRLVIKDAQLELEGIKVPALNVEATLVADNKLHSASLVSADGKFKMYATPKGEGYGIKLDAHQWIPPAGPPLLFDSLSADMSIQGNHLEVSVLDANFYRGTLNATAGLDWGKGWHSSGKFTTRGIELGEVAALFGKKKLLSGRLSGDGSFSANAKEAASLADHLVLNYKFNVVKGVLHGVDLAKAATLLLTAGGKGGETKFDEMTGTLHIAGKQIEMKPFKVVSGLLAASGGIKVSPAKQLDGKIEVELKKGMAAVSVPLQVSGTLDNPSVMPSKAVMAGAVAGTAMFGPGLGTSLGVKAGSGMDKIKGLFGGSK